MIYLLFGTQRVILEKRLKMILNENLDQIDDFHLQKFVATETTIQDIIYEVELPSLLGDKKAIVVYKPYFFSSERTKEKIEADQDYSVLEEYLDNPSPYNDLIFVLEAPKLNERATIVKKLLKVARVFEAKEITKEEWPRFIKQQFKKDGAEIDDDAVYELLNRIQGDASIFLNEEKKLVLYTKHIRLEDVELLVTRPLEENVFAILRYLLKGENDRAIEVYRDLLVENEEPVRLISLISSQLRFISEVKYLKNKGKSSKEIAQTLGVNEYRVYPALGDANCISTKKMHSKLDELYQLDLDIKSGKVDRFFAFEMFLIKF